MMPDVFYVVPALLILALGVYTTVARDTFAATVGFIAYGLLLTVAWVQLQGVDIALTEAAIGGGLTGLLLVRASAKLRQTEGAARAERPGRRPTRLLAAIMAGAVAAALALAVLALPDPAPTLAPEAVANIGPLGVGNPITAVLLAYRAMDTLLEAIVLLFVLIGVWSLAPDRAWGGRPGPRYNADPDGILAFIARVLPPIGIVVGIYIFWVGADHPGGKFQGATILAAMWLLTLMAGLTDAPPISRRWVRALLVLGPVAFIAIGVLGAFTAGAFLAWPAGWAKPLILVIEIALLPSLALTLGLMLAGAPERPPQP
jgi:multisubunit Na+/H+ antiporter MnhB subunit